MNMKLGEMILAEKRKEADARERGEPTRKESQAKVEIWAALLNEARENGWLERTDEPKQEG